MKCKKDITMTPDKEELPAMTQSGSNTFGFLLNGEVWLPKTPLLKERLDLSYDPNYKGGSFGIIANRYLSSVNQMELSIGLTGVNKPGKYTFNNNGVIYADSNSKCYYYEDRIVSGSLSITKIDLANNFISGTFEFKLEKQGCQIINATDGRFDLKIQ
ncbi:DUF6252 family protein [Pedobacter sp. Leaf216]|uniref:DUF6252 family protein n=1 Tax=Pedobacter sp. Leaf216 TaxID=1735684 RepID=UPI001F26681B|nr:DUF6252 family protein [Pedobacter sp. Leaf216]